MAKQKQKTVKKGTNEKKKSKDTYKTRNWAEYNEALKQRGALDVWVDEEDLETWHAKPSGKKGAPSKYSDMAIQITLQFGAIYHQRLRQTEGLVTSLFSMMNVSVSIPDYTTLSRRGISIETDQYLKDKEVVGIVVDSSGLKVYGEGEWKVRKHGYSKHRTWRKFHLAIDPEDGEIRAVETTTNSVSDSVVTESLLDQVDASINMFSGDGAYDKRIVYNLCIDRKIDDIRIPPQKNAKIWNHGNKKGIPHPRDENLRVIRKSTREKWKEGSGYHIRSLSETGMFRFKAVFGGSLNARGISRQKTEVRIKCAILNKMLQFGMPDSYSVAR